MPEQQVPMRRIWNRRGQTRLCGVDLPFDEGKTVLKPVGKLKAGNPAGGRTRQRTRSGKGGDTAVQEGRIRQSGCAVWARFDEEASPIEELEGEVGKVVNPRKDPDLRAKELRSGNTLFAFR